ncbi:glycerol dehydratase reactivase beta/small subunit family protein [Streptosporangium lutulentum]|uniref:PduH protein n=1 Tax=Streptosporangium lutulentum TaxID=1461250 RepID=A0ABT9QPU7_9ACTN|nr:glycerol dehydratase reactivase beta/small subunit family protein [Streptosporangium lutulentum]MDP9848752.1 hypothetical protein [Streptosporangium lutulentum]
MHHAPVDDRRSDRAGRDRPAVTVLHRPDPGTRRLLREITAGMEEEGVPYRVEEAADGGDGARELALAAAQASTLDVGIGVDAAGYICVHHAKLPPDAPAAAGPPSSARTMGHNAARLVVGIPFKQQEGPSHA